MIIRWNRVIGAVLVASFLIWLANGGWKALHTISSSRFDGGPPVDPVFALALFGIAAIALISLVRLLTQR